MLNFLIFLYLKAFKILCSTELRMKKFYNLGARLHVKLCQRLGGLLRQSQIFLPFVKMGKK